MDDGLNYLQTFNPGESKSELLEHTLIGRKDLVDRLEELVIEGSNSGNKFQRLIIGPRGSGKTHVLKVIHNRILQRTDLKDKLEIAYLCEDEYGVATFLDWIIRILMSFIRWEPEKAGYLVNEIEKLKKVQKDDQEKVASRILLNHISNQTLLIIVENIGEIFNDIGKDGQQKFRDLIQQYPYFTIMASNQALFKDIQKEDMPFHNFFKIIHLRKLSIEEAMTFLMSIAEWDKNSNLINFLNSPEGKGRINAIYDFTGGNHRLLVTFYQFLKTDYINKLSEIFIKTINDLTPYYQNMMRILSAQQQKIVQYLSQNRKPSTVKNIAENCFSKENTISRQMTTLVRLKYVDAIPSGRETFYELSEPLFRICNEVKENQGRPIKLFIDFLGNLYSAKEIKKRYMHYHILVKVSEEQTSLDFYQEQLFYREALKFYFPNTPELYEIDKFEKAGRDYQIQSYIEELERSKAYSDILKFTSKIRMKDKYLLIKEASAYGKIGDTKKEIEIAKSILKQDEKDIDALLLLAKALQKDKKFSESDEYFQKVLNIDAKNIEALNGLGTNFLMQDKISEAEQFFKQVISIEPENVSAIWNIGVAIGMQYRHQQAYDYFQKLVKLQPDYSEGWKLLGIAQENLKKIAEAKDSYLKALELDENNAVAVKSLGVLFANQDDYLQAYDCFQKLVELQPDYSEGWTLLGIAQENLEKIEEAKTSYEKAIELDEKNSNAILGLASIVVKEHNLEKANSYIEKVLKEKLVDSDLLNHIGEIYRESQQFENAISFYQQSIEADPQSHHPYFNLVSCKLALNSIKEAISQLDQVLKLASEIELKDEIIQCFQKNHTALFIHGLPENISTYLREAFVLIKDFNYNDQFFKSIPETIFDLLKQHEDIELERFEFIERYLNDNFKDFEQMIVPLKFLNIGIRHLKTKEKNVLMQFTKEERAIYKKFVLDRMRDKKI